MLNRTHSNTNWHDYVEARLSAYIDGELPDNERTLVRKHLADCPQCQASLDSLGWAIKLVKQLPAPRLPRQFTLPIPEPARTPARAPAFGWLRWGLAGVSAVAVLVFGIFMASELFQPSQATPSVVGMAPAAAPVLPTSAAAAPALQATTAPVAANDTARSASVPAPTSTPLPTVAPLSVPAAAPRPTQAPPRVLVTAIPPRPTATPPVQLPSSKAIPATALPSPTATCANCGGGAAPTNAPPGLGAAPLAPTTAPAIAPSPTPELSIESTGPSAAAAALPSGTVLSVQPLIVRGGPSLISPIIGELAPNTTAPIQGRDETGEWLQVLYPLGNTEGKYGWVAQEYVGLPVSIDELPIVAPAATPTAVSQGPAPAAETPTAVVEKATSPVPKSKPTLASALPSPTGSADPTLTGAESAGGRKIR